MTTQMDSTATHEIGPDERNALRFAAWKRRMDPIVMAAAILPIVVALTERGESEPAVWLDLASWTVFIVDFAVRLRLKTGYLRSRVGVFDLVIILLTAPWYLVPALDGTRVLGVARLGRVVRLFLVSSAGTVLRDLVRRLGRAALYSGVLMLCAALVVRAVEPAESGFATYGDALWWSMVTFTTVGYGDLFPVTAAGRIVATMLMIGGIALIGALSGALGSFFTGVDREHGAEDEQVGPDGPEPSLEPVDDPVLLELRAVRAELQELRRAVVEAGAVGDDPPGTVGPGG